ncbi:MAG TPA: hypothetical protein VGE11_21450 [Pseudonocardia sp.]
MPSEDAASLLRDRIADLDATSRRPDPAAEHGEHAAWEHAAWEMSAHTNTSFGRRPEELVLEPETADALVAASTLLAALDDLRPGVVRAPLDRLGQEWTAAAAWNDDTAPRNPSRVHFRDPEGRSGWRLPAFGLYTSTAHAAPPHTMWRRYLDQNAGLWRYPWYRWHLPVPPDARVAEIDSAKRWAEFVQRHHQRVDGFLYADWRSAAAEFDGIHLCFGAVVAVQSFSFRTRAGLVAPVYWDVEQTLWLRWRFGVPQLLDRVDRAP